MIFTDFEFDTYQRARCWIDELPRIPRLTGSSDVVRLDSTSDSSANARRAAVELLVPRGVAMYGLLGASVEPADEGFAIEIAYTTENLGRYEETIASQSSDEVRCGLHEEYLQAVVSGMTDAAMQLGSLPRGKVTCDVAACGAVGSCGFIFTALGSALVKLLLLNESPTLQNVSSLLVVE